MKQMVTRRMYLGDTGKNGAFVPQTRRRAECVAGNWPQAWGAEDSASRRLRHSGAGAARAHLPISPLRRRPRRQQGLDTHLRAPLRKTCGYPLSTRFPQPHLEP